jgi:uncharacterized protein involved in tolerance to divalent cations
MRAQKISRNVRKSLDINCISTVIQVTEIYTCYRDIVKGQEQIYIPKSFSNSQEKINKCCKAYEKKDSPKEMLMGTETGRSS